MSVPAEHQSRNFGVVRALALCVVAVLAFLLLVDLLIGRRLAASRIVTDVIDIQSTSALIAKARHVASFPGAKVILLGDSLIAGQVMREHGDSNWRDHTLSADLQRRFDKLNPGGTIVLNLGMNGILPADLETLVDALLPLRPDMLVLDVSLRSFSRDFATADASHSRPWLKPGFMLDQTGNVVRFGDRQGLDAAIERELINSWATYRVRDLLRARLLDGEPREVMQGLRKRMEGKGATAVAGPAQEMQLLLQVRGRYASASLELSNPQFAAWLRLLNKLRDAKQRAIVFYATESPRLLPSLMDSVVYRPLIEKLKATVVREGGARVTYLDANAALTDEMFLDHVHVDATGNKIYGEGLFKAINGG